MRTAEQSKLKRELYKDWALNNKVVIDYCNRNNISINKLKKLSTDYIIDRIVFLMPSNIKSTGLLSNDIDTQPKVVLGIVLYNNNGNIAVKKCESTEYTDMIK